MKMEQLINQEPKQEKLLNSVGDVVSKLDSLSNYIENLSSELSFLDSKISDLEHFIEHNKLDVKASCRIIKEFKKVVEDRRHIKNDIEISRIYLQHQNKLLGASSNRQFLISAINKANNSLNKPYRNRVYTEEEMNYLLGKENNENNSSNSNNILDTNSNTN